ncbi:MAG TPA: hypothetical protein VK957_21035 [Lunatimonas sp.]|nr:hypothetical protein [Lunatimonas sp.]
MLRAIYHIALIFVILLSGMNYSLIHTYFLINRAEIAAAYCENKEKPELACNGSCKLDSMLAKAKEQQEEKEQVYVEDLQINYILVHRNENYPIRHVIGEVKFTSKLVSSWAVKISLDFFHPPQLA